jgi:magnesium-transporting ATPase (P-type)
MRSANKTALSFTRRLQGWVYRLLFIVMAFTGFGQMPIFKRYYIADIPGMGWSADFYFTHKIHYIGAVLLLAVLTYAILNYFLTERKIFALTPSASVRIILLAGIVVTGIFRVLKNLPDVVFSPGFTMFIDISHLGFMMCYLFAAIVFLIMRSGWLRPHVSP